MLFCIQLPFLFIRTLTAYLLTEQRIENSGGKEFSNKILKTTCNQSPITCISKQDDQTAHASVWICIAIIQHAEST